MKSAGNNKSDRQDFVRLSRQSDRKALVRLWQDCFGDSDSFTRYYFDTYFTENTVWLLERGGRILAQLHENPYELCLGSEKIPGIYIVGVSTDENFRHQGAMTALLKKVFEEQLSKGRPFVYLMPADKNIYLPFQFAYIYDQEVVSLLPFKEKKEEEKPGQGRNFEEVQPGQDRDFIEGQPGRGRNFEEVQPGQDRDFEEGQPGRSRNFTEGQPGCLVTCLEAESEEDYKACVRLSMKALSETCNLFTARDLHYYKRLQLENKADGGNLLIFRYENAIIGYISYAWEEKAEIRDLCAVRGWDNYLRVWVMSHFADIDTSIFPLPGQVFSHLKGSGQAAGRFGREEERLLFTWHVNSDEKRSCPSYLKPADDLALMGNLACAHTMRPIIMGRIIDVESFLRLCAGQGAGISGAEKEIRLYIIDNWIGQNNGLWTWKFGDGSCQVKKVIENEAEEKSQLSRKDGSLKKDIENVQADVTVDIGGLFQWLTGYRSCQSLMEEGLMEAAPEAEELLKDVPVLGRICINEIV